MHIYHSEFIILKYRCIKNYYSFYAVGNWRFIVQLNVNIYNDVCLNN